MSIFREHKSVADRSASDRRRHKQKIEKAIKEGIHDIVAEESIIGQDGKKKIKIPVRGIKEYRFVYGTNENNKSVGSAPGSDIRRGQKISDNKKKSQSGPGKPGNTPGEEYYEVEITLEELSHYLFDDLQLPDLEKKSLKKIISERIKRKGYRKEGIRPRLDKKKSAIQRIKRKKATERSRDMEADDIFPFHENDLIYRHYKPTQKECSNAVIFFIMDVSGSMTKEKKFIARSFYFLLYHFIRSKYENTEIVFISHDTSANEVSEEQFFSRGNSGGTLVSTGLDLVCEIVNKRFHPSNWNIYSFQCSDGDNWPEDTNRTLIAAEKIRDFSQLFGYCEINPEERKGEWFEESRLSKVYESGQLTGRKMKIVTITSKNDIWPSFKALFGGRAPKKIIVSSGKK
jgi:sporulation protein YhbH